MSVEVGGCHGCMCMPQASPQKVLKPEGRSGESQQTRRPTPNPSYSRAILLGTSAQEGKWEKKKKKVYSTNRPDPNPPSPRSHTPQRDGPKAAQLDGFLTRYLP